MHKRHTILRILIISLFFSVFNLIHAIQYPDTIYIPVTFYDFHSDRTNPEFEQRHFGQLRTGMVASTLGDDGKPALGSTPYLNYYIKYWFKPWEEGAKGDSTIPNYDPHANYKEAWYVRDPVLNVEGWEKDYRQLVTYKGITKVDHDTSFKNIVIHDSLPFRHVGNGLYEYQSAEFFPLDKRGFGNEWNRELGDPNQKKNVNHNYSFTMQLHHQFVKKPGMTFDFSGDDDVWVFIDKKMQLDLGGIHEEARQSFQVDNISGLVNGKTYDLDVFYAERHSAESHIRITTNIIFSPSNIRLYKHPGTPDVGVNTPIGRTDSLPIDVPVAYYGHVFDSSGVWHPEFDEMITWEVIDNKRKAKLDTNKGPKVTITTTEPGSEIVLIARFKNPNDPTGPENEVRVTLYTKKIDNSAPFKLLLYGKSGEPNVNGNDPLGASISIPKGSSLQVYGHLFNETNVWQSQMDQYIKWKTLEGNIVLDPKTGAHTSMTFNNTGTYNLVATFSDPVNLERQPSEARLTIKVTSDVSPYKLRLYGKDGDPDVGGNTPLGGSVTVAAGQELPVYGHLFDSVNVWQKQMDQYIKWRMADNLSIPNPTAGVKTSVTLNKIGSYTLIATFSDPTNLARQPSEATLVINVTAGPAVRLEIIEDSIPKKMNGDDNFNEIVISKDNKTVRVYAILRDKLGNYIGPALNAIWRANDPSVIKISPISGRYTDISMQSGTGVGDFITAVQDGMADSLKITSTGNESITATSNPAVPGEKIKFPNGQAEKFYENVISQSGDKGTMISIETVLPLKPINPSDPPGGSTNYGKVSVYDAVGNIIRTDLKLIYASNLRFYGIVWDLTNKNNRYVGTGTYLFHIRGVMSDGKPFNNKIKIGVGK